MTVGVTAVPTVMVLNTIVVKRAANQYHMNYKLSNFFSLKERIMRAIGEGTVEAVHRDNFALPRSDKDRRS